MTVRVLVVEDEADFVEELQQVFAELEQPIDVKVATCRDAALTALSDDFYDLIVLDLKLPTVADALNADPTHGHAVFAHAGSVCPGTPILVLTGSSVEDFIPRMLASKQQTDIWSEGRTVGSVDFLQKYKFDEVPEKLRPIVNAVHGLSSVELDVNGSNLSLPEERLIRIFARRYKGVQCKVTRLGGGLSGAKVVRLRIRDASGVLLQDAVAKLGELGDIRDEAARFDAHVSRLEPKATPRGLATLEFGAGPVAGVFYGLATGFDATAFDLAFDDAGRAQLAVQGIASATSRWRDGVPQTRRTISELRRRVLADDDAEAVKAEFELGWASAFEAKEIQTCWSCIHGDLHGSNALVAADGAAVLIDYGDVGEGPASLDPVTLELSLIFHPQRIDLKGWPSRDQARSWGDLEAYLIDCPSAEFVRACREWAGAAGAGKREIAGSAYAYLLRQLKYGDTDKQLVLALLDGVKTFYDAT